MDKQPKVLVLVDDVPGNSNQSIELANKLSDNCEFKKVTYTGFCFLPNFILNLFPFHVSRSVFKDFFSSEEAPDVIVSAGRRLAVLSLYLAGFFAKMGEKKPKLVQIMKPELNPERFDAIILPQHDRLQRSLPNIVRVIGALVNVDKKIKDNSPKFKATYPAMQKFIAVVIGGTNKSSEFGVKEAKKLVETLKDISRQKSLKLFITFSRRTPDLVKKYIKNNILSPHMIFSPGDDDINPYPTMLGLADAIIVTPDSVSMCSEAVGTGRPVYIYSTPGFSSPKHKYFSQQLVDIGVAKRLDADKPILEEYKYSPLNELDRVAKIVKDKIFVD